jgi:phosphoglycolate phosphatase-like HAD superfamily hydrolase
MRYDDYPAASADDAADRESIIKLALGRACGPTDQSSPGAIYIGDGVWDVRACYKAAIPFLGIAVGAQKEKLAAAGAVHVLPDFSDQDRFLSCIEKIFAI